MHNSLKGPLEKKIFYLHIPKCGGMSIRDAIIHQYQTLDRLKDSQLFSLSAAASSNVVKLITGKDYPKDTVEDYQILKFREELLLYMIELKKKFISGHFPLSNTVLRHLQGKYALVVILRNPVNRWISSYFFNRYKISDHRKINEDVMEHLDTPFGRSQGYELVKFIGGHNKEGDYTSSEAIQRAIRNLHRFDIIGFLEHIDLFVDSFHTFFNRRLNIKQKNTSPVSKSYQQSIIDKTVSEKIAEICSPDCQLYEYAVQYFLHASQGPHEN